MFKSALVALKPSSTQQFVINYAVDLAHRHALELAVCTVVDPERVAPPESVPLGASSFKKHHDEQMILNIRNAAQGAVDACTAVCNQRGVTCHPAVYDGDTPRTIVCQAHEHDLLIVGHTQREEDSDESLLHQILKHSSRPAIVFPKKPVTGEAVVIAYDGSMQAGRTLASFAYSGLADKRPVHVVSFHTDPQTAAAWSHQACRFLKRHGIHAISHSEALPGAVTEAVLKKVDQFSAGLLVIGAFGTNTVREFLFGSVTRSLLQSVSVPIFLNH